MRAGSVRAISPPRVSRAFAAISAEDVLWLIVAVLFSLALRVPFFDIPMIHDEGGYAYATRGWINGTGQLYGDLWISRPQGIFVLYALIFDTLGEGVRALRFTAWAFAAITIVTVWLFGHRWSPPRIANLAAMLTAVLLSLPNLEGFTANAEIFMGAPAAVAAWLVFRTSVKGWDRWPLLGVGLMIGIATSLKPSGIVMLLVAWIYVLSMPTRPRRDRWISCGWILLGCAVIGGASALHGWYLGWHRFLFATVTYRLTMQSSATVSLRHHLIGIGGLAWAIAPLIGLVLALGIFRLRFPMPASNHGDTLFDRALRNIRGGAREMTVHERGSLLVALWSIGAFLGIAMGGDWWPHYVIQIVPPLALWLAWNLDRIASALSCLWRGVFLALVLGLTLLPYAITEHGQAYMLTSIYDHPGYPAQADVARYIHDHTTPDDTIYVAFDQASIYYLSDRRPAYRYLYDQELRAMPNSYADIIEIIRGPERPKYIISTLHPGPFPDRSTAFWQEVGKYYVLETEIEGVPIYRAKDDPVSSSIHLAEPTGETPLIARPSATPLEIRPR